MASGSRPPEQVIRDWLDSNGTARVGLEAFEQTWGIERMGARDRRHVAAALARVGVQVDPPLARISRSDKVTLTVAGPQVEAPPVEELPYVEPEPEHIPEPEPEPEHIPAPAPEPEPEPEYIQPEPEYVEPEPEPGPRAPRRRRPWRRQRIWTDPGAAPPPVEPEPEYVEPEPEYIEPEPEYAEPEPEYIEPEPEYVEPEPEYVEPEPEYVEPEPEPEPPPRRRRRGRRERIWAESPPLEEPPPVEEPPPPVEEPPAPVEEPPEPAEEAGPSRPTEPLLSRITTPGWVLIGGATLMVLGALGPWAKAILITDYGLQRKGWIVLLAAVVIVVALGLHLRRARDSWLPLVGAGASTFSAAVIVSDYRTLLDDSFVGPDWGLYMAFIGSAVLIGLSVALLVRRT